MTAQLAPEILQAAPEHGAPETLGAWSWTPVCRYDALIPERGVAALVNGAPVAVFRTFDGALYALSNVDPFSAASVLSRGIVGDRQGRPTVASPIYKQVFELATGVCLDDPTVRVAACPVRVIDGVVEVGPVGVGPVGVGPVGVGHR